MELHEYPRPANDTGIGVHWTVGFASAIGVGRIRDFWIPELKALGVKWVKVFNHDGAIDFAELLLSEGIMPIVRIFRPSPNPSTLDVRDIVHLDTFIRTGVRYFEFNSEPDRDAEWKGGRVPANGLELVVDSTIANLETILERGGMPGIPAVANGSLWDLVGRIAAKGRADLLNGPVWQAIHNYARNRPLDYPYDNGNQEGAPYSQRFYDVVAGGDWGEDPWRGRSLLDVNRLRHDRCNPGATIADDSACWLGYEFFDTRIRKHLGRSLPILSTECGYLVGEDIDPRYPATTPDLHMAQTLEACRILMGSSTRFQIAPDYYFCSAFWLLGNGVLGSSSNWWEHHAWYSEKLRDSMLPVVRALKNEPKKVRQWQSQGNLSTEVGARARLHGTVSYAGAQRELVVEKNGQEIARAALDANSRYSIADLPAGNYLLRMPGTSLEQPVSIPPDQTSVQVNLDLSQSAGADVGGSVIHGHVRGGAGTVVTLLRAGDGEDWVTMPKDDGSFRFVQLTAGTYTLHVQAGDNIDLTREAEQLPPLISEQVEVTLDGQNQRRLELEAPGWGYTIRLHEADAQSGVIHCLVPGHRGLQVQATRNEWRSEPSTTGSAPEIGEDACAITGLDPGSYSLNVSSTAQQAALDGAIRVQASVSVDRRHVAQVEFVYHDAAQTPVEQPHASSIRGRIIGGCRPEERLYVWLMDQEANRREQLVGEDCTFAFDGLGPGLYSVEVAGHADVARRPDITLDGRNHVHVELMVPIEEAPQVEPEKTGASSIIQGSVPDGAGRRARLVDSVGNELKQAVEPDNTFYFAGLPADVYTLHVEGGYQLGDLTLDGTEGVEVIFQPLQMHWEAKASIAGSMPGYSVIRVEVEGMRGLPVYIWKEDWEGMMRRTGSKTEYGECSAEFSPLGPGIYMVEPEGLNVYADVELTGLEVVWVDFRRRAVPESPHEVRALSAGGRAPEPRTRDAREDGHGSRDFDGQWHDAQWENTQWESTQRDNTAWDDGQRGWHGAADAQQSAPRETLASLRFDDLSHAPPDDWLRPLDPPTAPDVARADEPEAETHPTQAADPTGTAAAFRMRDEPDVRGHSAAAHENEHVPEGTQSGVEAAREPGRAGSVTPVSTEQRAPKPYVFLVETLAALEDQLALLRYVAEHGSPVGQELSAALEADWVLLVAPSLPAPASQPQAQDTATQPAARASSDTDNAPGAQSHDPAAEDDLGDFDWNLDVDADAEAWPDWPPSADDEPEPEPAATNDADDADDATIHDDLAHDSLEPNLEHSVDRVDQDESVPSPHYKDKPQNPQDAPVSQPTPAAKPETSVDDLYSAWVAAKRKRDQAAAIAGQSAAEIDAGPLHSSESGQIAQSEPAKGKQDNSPDGSGGAILASDSLLLETVEAIEKELRARGVRWKRLTGNLAVALATLEDMSA